MSTYGIEKQVRLGFEDAVERVTEALKHEGFGVLTTIDVQETLRKKLNADFHKYVILGACNPPFAYQALQADNQVGLLLPCNVVVQEKDGVTTVSAFDPMTMGKIMDNPAVEPIAHAVRAKLEAALEKV